MGSFVARAEIDVAAPRAVVWRVLTFSGGCPESMFGADVESDWRVGSPIVWRGEWQGRAFEDHGRVIELEDRDEPWRIVLTHFSPSSGLDGIQENYHTIRMELDETSSGTHVTLDQDNNATVGAAQHARENWAAMLRGVKTVAEREAG